MHMAAADPSHEEIKQDILTNPRYAEFFASYHPKVQASFADSYAHHKVQWQWKGTRAEADQTHASSRFSEAAYARLWDVQHKKLFDLQCRWRAVQESQRSQLLAHLPQVYEEYQLRQSLGITHPKAAGPDYRRGEHSAGMREDLLDGREALGEPRNFDFYD